MKRIWTAVILLIAVIGLCTVCLTLTERMTQSLTEDTKKLLLASDGDLSVGEKLELLDQKWERYESILSLYTRHGEIEEVGASIGLLDRLWSEGEYKLFRVVCEDVLISVRHLKETEEPKIRNIM